MAEEKKKVIKPKKKEVDYRDLTTCDATLQMLNKARLDGVETAWSATANAQSADEAGNHERVFFRRVCRPYGRNEVQDPDPAFSRKLDGLGREERVWMGMPGRWPHQPVCCNL